MRVVLHTTAAGGARTGVGHYTAQLWAALNARPDVRIFPYPNVALSRLRERLGGGRPPEGWDGGYKVVPPEGGPVRDIRMSPRHWVRGPFRWTWRMVMAAYARGAFDPRYVDLYHEPNFFPLRAPKRLPIVVTVHDLSVLLHSNWHPAERAAQFGRDFLPRVRDFAHIVTDSDAARQEIIATLQFPAERVTRAYPGVRSHFRRLPAEEVATTTARLGLPSQYFLHVGTIEPRKNLKMLLQAFVDLPNSLRERCPLVMVGPWGWRFEEVAEFYERVAKHRQVIHLGYAADADLPAIYNAAKALVFPTHYEGFGLPAAEMLACGGAVIASKAAAVGELLGGCGATTDTTDQDSWRDTLRRAIEDPEWLEGLKLGAIERSRTFTWEQCADDTIRAYRSVLRK